MLDQCSSALLPTHLSSPSHRSKPIFVPLHEQRRSGARNSAAPTIAALQGLIKARMEERPLEEGNPRPRKPRSARVLRLLERAACSVTHAVSIGAICSALAHAKSAATPRRQFHRFRQACSMRALLVTPRRCRQSALVNRAQSPSIHQHIPTGSGQPLLHACRHGSSDVGSSASLGSVHNDANRFTGP